MSNEPQYRNSFFSRLTKIGEAQANLRFTPFTFSQSDTPILEVTIQSPIANWEDISALLDSEVFYIISDKQIEITNWDWDEPTVITGNCVTAQNVPYDREDLFDAIAGLTAAFEKKSHEHFKASKLIRELTSFLTQLKERAIIRTGISEDQSELQRANLQTINKLLQKLGHNK